MLWCLAIGADKEAFVAHGFAVKESVGGVANILPSECVEVLEDVVIAISFAGDDQVCVSRNVVLGIFDPGDKELSAERVVDEVGVRLLAGSGLSQGGLKAGVAVFREEAATASIFVDEVSELYSHVIDLVINVCDGIL
jgi:hypothetical protein